VSRMTSDDLIEWCGSRGATLRWCRDDYGRQAIEVTLPRDPDPVMLTVAANAPVRPADLLADAVERWARELAVQERRRLLRVV